MQYTYYGTCSGSESGSKSGSEPDLDEIAIEPNPNPNLNPLLSDEKITFEDFCAQYKITYSIKPYPYDTEKNIIDIPQRTIYPGCVICIGNCLMAKEYLARPLTNQMINYLRTFSGHDQVINNIIDKVYNYVNKFSPNPHTHIIIFVTYNHIYFQLTDRLFEKYVLFHNKPYTTHILFGFQFDKLNNELVFEYNNKKYPLDDINLSKIVSLYKNKYIINQQIQNMYYVEHSNGIYYIKGMGFGETILKLEVKTNDLENVYIKYNNKQVDISRLDNIVKNFNLYKKN